MNAHSACPNPTSTQSSVGVIAVTAHSFSPYHPSPYQLSCQSFLCTSYHPITLHWAIHQNHTLISLSARTKVHSAIQAFRKMVPWRKRVEQSRSRYIAPRLKQRRVCFLHGEIWYPRQWPPHRLHQHDTKWVQHGSGVEDGSF